LRRHIHSLPVAYNLFTLEKNNNQRSSKLITKHCKKRNSGDGSNNASREITNLPSHPPICLEARPSDAEINAITRVNNMLSNFVVTYFFKSLEQNFPSILYKEFLFDFVRREGGWKQFIQYS